MLLLDTAYFSDTICIESYSDMKIIRICFLIGIGMVFVGLYIQVLVYKTLDWCPATIVTMVGSALIVVSVILITIMGEKE